MRGKNILLLAMLLSIAMTSIMTSIVLVEAEVTSETKVLVEPTVSTALPGELFSVSVEIEKVNDLYGFEFKLGYVPGTRVLGALVAEEGGFLWGPDGTSFAYYVEKVHGYIHVGCSILGMWPGVSGSGTLATVQFVVAEAGESDLHLYDVVLVDSSLNPMPTQTRDGYFDGVNTELVMINIGSRTMHVGQTQVFQVKANHEDPNGIPLYTKARIDNTRVEDGRTTTLWSGQSYQYPPVRDPIDLYVDGYTAERQQWTEVGTSPFLDAPGDGSYLEGSADGAQHRWFTFEDFELGDSIIDYVQLWGYCDGPYNEGVDYDVYYTGFNWLGSLYGTGAGPEWITPRWTGADRTSDIEPSLLTEAGVNNAEVLVYFFDPDGAGGPGNIVDCLRLHVVFKAGRAPEEPVVDGYTAERQQWTEVGAEPWLNAPDDGNYLEGSADGAQHRWFTFEDVDIGTSVIDYVQLWGYTDGPYNEGVDYDVYCTGFNWLGSLYGTGAGPEWITPRWTGADRTSDIEPSLLTEAGINNFEVLVYFFDPGLVGGPGNIVDCLKLEITFKADRVALPLNEELYLIQPGEVRWLDTIDVTGEIVGTLASRHTESAVQVGLGDNATTSFPLDFMAEYMVVDGSVIVYYNGVETSDTYWPNTVDYEAATVTFDTAPLNVSTIETELGVQVGIGDGKTKVFSFASLAHTPIEGSIIVYVNGTLAGSDHWYPCTVDYEAQTITFSKPVKEPLVITVDYNWVLWHPSVITVDFVWVDQTLSFGLANIGPVISGSEIVYLNGAVTTDYSIDYATGIITFPTLTASPTVIIADYTYDTEYCVWPLQPEDVGTYICTITLYYSYGGTFFYAAQKHVITETWRVLPPK